MKKSTVDAIDKCLPQTQCGLCDYPGCRPYATAIAEKKASIDRCPPGGTETLLALAALLEVDATPFIEPVRQRTKAPVVAVIREDECIGCTKCIQACPTDAILGSGKQMHTVIEEACTGCELCIEPCPVDCIDLVAAPKRDKADQWRERYEQRKQRLQRLSDEKKHHHQQAKKMGVARETIANRRAAIAAAIERHKNKKL